MYTSGVTCVRWGGEGYIYSASRDRTIKVWDEATGAQVRSCQSHGHWVTTMGLNNDHVLRVGGFDPDPKADKSGSLYERAKRYYDTFMKGKQEQLVSGSDDFSLHLWGFLGRGGTSKPITRMVGHQQPVVQVGFSPNGRLIASASFDKSVRLWDAATGKFVVTLRGHVERVYQVCWVRPQARSVVAPVIAFLRDGLCFAVGGLAVPVERQQGLDAQVLGDADIQGGRGPPRPRG